MNKDNKPFDNNIYNVLQNRIDYNLKKTEEFFDVLKSFQEAETYEKRVKLMNKTWSKETLSQIPTKIFYGDLCYIRIYMEDNKYKFEFQCEKISIEDLKKYNPKIAEENKEKFQIVFDKLNELYGANLGMSSTVVNQTNLDIYKNMYLNQNIKDNK